MIVNVLGWIAPEIIWPEKNRNSGKPVGFPSRIRCVPKNTACHAACHLRVNKSELKRKKVASS